MKELNIEKVSIADAAKILNISKEEVRDLCRSGHLKFHEGLKGNPCWGIYTEQLKGTDGWKRYIDEYKIRIEDSKKFVKVMIEILSDEEDDRKKDEAY